MEAKKRRPRIDGVVRRHKIKQFLSANPGSSALAIARGVGLATWHRTCPTLESHLNVLELEGGVRCDGNRWWPTTSP